MLRPVFIPIENLADNTQHFLLPPSVAPNLPPVFSPLETSRQLNIAYPTTEEYLLSPEIIGSGVKSEKK